MRKKLLIAFGVLVGLLVAFAGVVALQPDEFRIVRSIKITAPADAVFPHVNDLRLWEAWSPWAKLDPAAKNSFAGPESGTGAVFKWSGNSEVGEGQMTVTESLPSDRIKLKLEFLRPFEDTSDAEFIFTTEGDQTTVTWAMFGKQNFPSKAICLFMNMDQMLGGQFDQGLTQLKSIVETSPKTATE